MKGLLIFFVITGFLFAQEKPLTVTAEAFRVEPKKVSFNESLINNLNVPDGFTVDTNGVIYKISYNTITYNK